MAQNKSYKELMELQGQSGGAAGGGAATSNQMLELILGRKPAQYNAATDPAAQAARKTAARNAQAATRHALGQYAGMTGGVPSTAAVSAAAQAGNQAMAQGADRVAELEQLYLDNYNRETQGMYDAYGALLQSEGDAFNRQMQEQQWDFQKEQDAYNRQMQEQQWAYQKEQDQKAAADAEYQKKLAMAQLKASYGDLSGLEELGIDTSKYTAGGGGGGSGYRGAGSGGTGGSGGNGGSGGGGITAAVKNELTMLAYDNGGYIPADKWAEYAAKYGETALIDAGFKKKQEQSPAPGGGRGGNQSGGGQGGGQGGNQSGGGQGGGGKPFRPIAKDFG